MIDFIYIFLLAIALWKGFKKGLIVALFSFVAIFIGLAAAMKLSTEVAQWLQASANINSHLLPFISFALVMIAVLLAVRWSAALVETAMDVVMLGWFNKVAGAVLYIALYTTVYSVVLFYGKSLGVLKPQALETSQCYAFIQPWGPKAIDGLAVVIPWFKDMFLQLQQYFGDVSTTLDKSI